MPGRLRSFYNGSRFLSKTRRTPIRIPQSPTRPLLIHKRDLFRRDLVNPSKWFFVTHHRGPRRRMVGQDPNEIRAVSKSQVHGTILERIIWQWLTDRKISFDFQSSLLGGRQELGGLVADFIVFPHQSGPIILNPTGPTHNVYIQGRKDDEQRMTLEQMGYTVYLIPEDVVLNEMAFEGFMRRILDLGIGNADAAGGGADTHQVPQSLFRLPELTTRLQALQASIASLKAIH